MKKIISMVCFIAVLFSGFSGNTAFASASDTLKGKARFVSLGGSVSVVISTPDVMQGGSFVICYNPSAVRYEQMTEYWWSNSVEELEEGKIRISFQDVVNFGTGYSDFLVDVDFEWIGSGTPEFSVEDVIVYDKEGKVVPVEKEECFSEFYAAVPDWEYNEETKTLTVGGTGFLVRELIEDNTWDFCRKEAKCIILEDGITGIDHCYFEDFTALEKVTVPRSVKTIKEDTFSERDSFLEKPNKFVIEGEAMTEAERFATACQHPFKPVNPVLLGDIDQDHHLTANDALEILKMDVKMIDCYGYTADVDENGKVDADDAVCVLKSTVGLR